MRLQDGAIVILEAEGRSNFRDHMARRGESRYCAFDLLRLMELIYAPGRFWIASGGSTG
jgi:hypothetical protein